MRQLLTIFHYELLMQLKSVRFKATCLLAALVALGLYTSGVQLQELPDLQQTLLAFQSSPMYLIAIAFTGLFSIGRIRAAGMHPILMAKPFPTFALLLGQLLAGLCALLIPLFLLLFPERLVLQWQYDVDAPVLPLLHVILFFMIPLICCVLAVTIWLRTCFKNTLVAIIILAVFFAATAVLSEKYLTIHSVSPDGSNNIIHRFVPMVSYMSPTYWRGRMRILDQPQVSFLRGEDWIDWAASILYCNVFLMLGGYHLRRTEPQRKVLGSYGRHWYHTPTFLKMACDLKIDPNVTWRHHFILFGMIALIFLRTVWPMLPQDARPVANSPNSAAHKAKTIDVNHFPENRILQFKIYDDTQFLTPGKFTHEMIVSIDGDTSGTTAIVSLGMRLRYDPRIFSMDGKILNFRREDDYCYIEGNQLKPFADRGKHRFRIEAERKSVQNMNAIDDLAERLVVFGFKIANGKYQYMTDNGDVVSYFSSRGQKRVPIHLSVEKPAVDRLLFSRIKPAVHKNGEFTRYDFEFTTQTRGLDYYLFFASANSYVTLHAPTKNINLTLGVPRTYEKVAADLIELAQPVLVDFCKLHDLPTSTPMFFYSPLDHYENEQLLKQIRKYQNIYRYRRYFYPYEKEQFLKLLNTFEKCLLKSVFIWNSGYWFQWDMDKFLTDVNLTKGLNHRLALDHQYEPPVYAPQNAHLSAAVFNTLKEMSREKVLLVKSDWPVFQMLYLVLGHEQWQAMMLQLRNLPTPGEMSVDLVQHAAETATGQSLAWFFDYWLRTGKDYPCYQIESATAKLAPAGPDDKTQYTVKAVIKNIGTGRMPVPLRLLTSRDPIDDKVWIDAGQTVTWTVTSRTLPKSITVDPDGWILTKPYWVEKNRVWVVTPSQAVKIE